MKFKPNARIRNSSKDGAYDEILFTPTFAIGAVRVASVALAMGSGAMLVVLGATVMLLFKSQLKLLDAIVGRLLYNIAVAFCNSTLSSGQGHRSLGTDRGVALTSSFSVDVVLGGSHPGW